MRPSTLLLLALSLLAAPGCGDRDCEDSGEESDDCESGGDKAGRPLSIDGAARCAAAEPRRDWAARSEAAPRPDGAAARWIQQGLAEHASVASFSRFALILLHHGAPAALVARAHQAALDEVRHARLCFGAAAALGGAPVGPGPLDVRDALAGQLDLAAVVRALVAEGCVDETLAALRVAHLARQEPDPALAAIHREIAEDEARHADLAWDVLAWLLDAHPALAPEAEAAFAAAEARLLPTADRVDRVGLEAVVAPLRDALGARAEA